MAIFNNNLHNRDFKVQVHVRMHVLLTPLAFNNYIVEKPHGKALNIYMYI